MHPRPPFPRAGESVYRITVAGRVGDGWAGWFDADAVWPGDESTEIVVRVADQAELFGRLRRVQDLNLRLLEVILLDPSPRGRSEPGPTPGREPSPSDI